MKDMAKKRYKGADMKKSATAVAMHDSGYNCAQSVLHVFMDEINMTEEEIIRIAGGLGGGVRSGEICGAASGAVIAISAKYGFTVEKKFELYKIVTDFISEFKKRSGSLVCRELIGYDFSDPEQQAQAIQKEVLRTVCPKYITAAVEILEEMFASGRYQKLIDSEKKTCD